MHSFPPKNAKVTSNAEEDLASARAFAHQPSPELASSMFFTHGKELPKFSKGEIDSRRAKVGHPNVGSAVRVSVRSERLIRHVLPYLLAAVTRARLAFSAFLTRRPGAHPDHPTQSPECEYECECVEQRPFRLLITRTTPARLHPPRPARMGQRILALASLDRRARSRASRSASRGPRIRSTFLSARLGRHDIVGVRVANRGTQKEERMGSETTGEKT